jgi:hypothetical protein
MSCTRFPRHLPLLLLAPFLFSTTGAAQEREIPEPLVPWKDWVTWDAKHLDCPRLFSSADQPVCFWPATLQLSADEATATWTMKVRAFEATWVPLPGERNTWPMQVRDGEEPVVVIEREGRPVVKLEPGDHELNGQFRWSQMPQKLAIPPEIGILTLRINNTEIAAPTWDTNGEVWFKRIQGESREEDRLGTQVYRVIEDGVPMWLRTEIELTVSGKSREESLGWILPEGWQLSSVDSPIPVALDDRGQMRAQVRAGKWTIVVDAFRTTDPGEIRFPVDSQPVVGSELVGLKLDPGFRIAQIEGLPTIDVSQTTFPEKWRGLPVFQWETSQTFRLVEKQRGSGDQSPEGLNIYRRLWLDEDGAAVTYTDQLRGRMQQLWRLDVAEGYELGAVRIDGENQLITENPETSARGIEVRARNLNMEAIGRAPMAREINATGWQADADSLQLTFMLPPGWRALAIFGADRVQGDWLTAWSLLDLFLLLIFALAIYRMYGLVAGLLALVAFALAYHEPTAPRFTWFLLLIPMALLRVVREGKGKKALQFAKGLAIAILLLFLVPFITRQLQGVIYPQLETSGFTYGQRGLFEWPRVSYSRYDGAPAASLESIVPSAPAAKPQGQARQQSARQESNLYFDPQSRIQTGPAQPTWNWNSVDCLWNGPVTAEDSIRMILVSRPQHRILTVLRVTLLIWLAVILIRGGKLGLIRLRGKPVVAAAMLIALIPSSASAQLPERELLDELRRRLLELPDVFPDAAQIPSVDLNLNGNEIEIRSNIHAAMDVAVPLPGKIPAWSPLTVTLDGSPDALVTRRDGYLWVLVPKGVHEVVAKGLLGDSGNWEWTFLLKPKRVTISAPGWKLQGVNQEGVPDAQVFFTREQPVSADQAAYDRTDFHPIVVVDRSVEIGLVSRVHTTVTRLSQSGKAISLQVPLLNGEGVLSSDRTVTEGQIAVSLGANENEFSWDSELPSGVDLRLTAPQTDRWVERWHLVTSPVWNVAMTGLRPTFQSNDAELVPLWQPWPGESVELAFRRPIAIGGDVLTVQSVTHDVTLGSRRRSSELAVSLVCSLASDFVIELSPEAEIITLQVDNVSVAQQRDGARLIVPVNPGNHAVSVKWNTPEKMATLVRGEPLTFPAAASNITSVMKMPENRWILWAEGPVRGPAVRFWIVLVLALLIALALGSVPLSPLRRWEWALLAVGLTQVPLIAAMIVVAWLFALAYRGRKEFLARQPILFNLSQLALVFMTFVSLIILMFVVGAGLLGHPDMFIVGNGSSRLFLNWFEPRSGPSIPTPTVVSVSVWFYRLLMLFWALWLAASLLKWLTRGWQQFTLGGAWRRRIAMAELAE